MSQISTQHRSIVALLALATSLGACGSGAKKDEKTEKTAAAAKAESSAKKPTATATADAEEKPAAKGTDWEKVERVPFAKLQSLLPESLGGLKRTDLGGSTTPDGEHTYSEGVADYAGDDEVSMHVSVQDHPALARDQMPTKTTTFETYPVVGESEGGGAAELRIIVGERFLVSVNANKRTVAQVKEAVKTLDLAKLASWKGEGLPKK